MPHPLEYIVDGAEMLCNKGTIQGNFIETANLTRVKVSDTVVSIAGDKMAIVNIPCFGMCTHTGSTCQPVPVEWQDTYKAKVNDQETLVFESQISCAIGEPGGLIKFISSGQVAIPPEDMQKIMDEFGEDASWGWWDTAELVPVAGSAIGIFRSAAKGNGWMALANVGFLVSDVAGIFTLGTSTAASTAAKAALKAGVSAAKATVAKMGGKMLKKGASEAYAKAVAKKADEIAATTGQVCVKACFPAGTLVAVKDGHKNIEDIKVGDLVWAYNETTGESDLKPVVATMQNEVDATVKITLSEDVIESTVEHPFYTRKGWKAAGDLTTQDELKTKEGKWETIKALKSLFDKKKVYNFEVADWHTYFVGAWEWVVHNAKKCKGGKGRASNKLKRDPQATGDHSTFRRGDNGQIYKYETYEKTKTGHFNPVKRYDGGRPDGTPGAPHVNSVTQQAIPTPHVQGKNIPGGVRAPKPGEIPKKPK